MAGQVTRYQFVVSFYQYAEQWARNEIGSNAEVNVEKLNKFMETDYFLNHFNLEMHCKEDTFKKIDEMIFGGFPIWDFLDISDWIREKLEIEYESECEKKDREIKKKYKCYSCSKFKEQITSFGVLHDCKDRELWDPNRHGYRRGPMKLRRKCKYYENIRKKG